jgi:hypothetical protein
VRMLQHNYKLTSSEIAHDHVFNTHDRALNNKKCVLTHTHSPITIGYISKSLSTSLNSSQLLLKGYSSQTSLYLQIFIKTTQILIFQKNKQTRESAIYKKTQISKLISSLTRLTSSKFSTNRAVVSVSMTLIHHMLAMIVLQISLCMYMNVTITLTLIKRKGDV